MAKATCKMAEVCDEQFLNKPKFPSAMRHLKTLGSGSCECLQGWCFSFSHSEISTFMFGGKVLQLLSPKPVIHPKWLQWQVLLKLCPISLRIGSLGVETASSGHFAIWLCKNWSTKRLQTSGAYLLGQGFETYSGNNPNQQLAIGRFHVLKQTPYVKNCVVDHDLSHKFVRICGSNCWFQVAGKTS